MSQDRLNPFHLSGDQHSRLVDLLLEQYRIDLSKADFADRVLQLLEDIAGFENATDSDTQSVINTLWSLYRDQ